MKSVILSKNRAQTLAALRDKKGREQTGQVILEGLRLMNQLAIYGVYPAEVYHVAGFDLSSVTAADAVPCYECKDFQLKRFCDTDSPPKVAGLYPLPKESKVPFRKAFYLDRIADPGNLGTIFRLSKAFGMDAILLSEACAEVSSPKVIRASLGAVYSLPFSIVSPDKLDVDKWRIVGTEASAELKLRDFSLSRHESTLIVLGSEAHGISTEIKELCRQTLSIEMRPESESINVSVAAGIIAHSLYGL
jgi:TrmH family RNA methyltransferase